MIKAEEDTENEMEEFNYIKVIFRIISNIQKDNFPKLIEIIKCPEKELF